MQEKKKRAIPIIKTREVVMIPLEDVLYIESDARRIAVRLDEETHWMYAKLADIEVFLDCRFYKCHSRCIINFDRVVRMKSEMIIFDNQEQIYLSRQKYTEAVRAYKRYLLKKGDRP